MSTRLLGTKDAALELLRERRVVSLTDAGAVPSLVRAVTGGPVPGSWWGHPRGAVIYTLAEALSDSGEALVLKLVHGKVTFVHEDLWPALVRVATDERWRGERTRRLKPPARRLLQTTERAGEVRMDELASGLERDGARALARARLELERSLLVLSEQVHAEKGAHATILRSWDRFAKARPTVARRARKLTLEDALAAVDDACSGEPTSLGAARRR